jgi:hypothetical protein
MTRAHSFTKASIKRRIEAKREAGLLVTGITADGTVLTAVDRPETYSTGRVVDVDGAIMSHPIEIGDDDPITLTARGSNV